MMRTLTPSRCRLARVVADEALQEAEEIADLARRARPVLDEKEKMVR